MQRRRHCICPLSRRKSSVLQFWLGSGCWEGSATVTDVEVGSGDTEQQHLSKGQHPVAVPGTGAPASAQWLCSNLPPYVIGVKALADSSEHGEAL